MNRPEIAIIVARATNGTIGFDGSIPWHLPADLRRFKQLTMGAPMIMGRKTFESLPGLLPERRHIVVTRDTGYDAEGAEIVHSFEAALASANAPHVWVIGGAEIYAAALPYAQRIELTEVQRDYAGDTMLPGFGPEWEEVAREHHPADGQRPAFDFVSLVRKAG